jgi:Amt family ammonium transporter
MLVAGVGVVARADAPPSSATAELKDAAAKAPTTATLAAGDPGGTITGTVSDVPVSDAKTGLTLGDVANQVGQNKIGINFTWTLLCGLPGHVHAGRLRDG